MTFPFTSQIAASIVDLPTATLFYLILYLASWVLHVVFMGYVLAGSAYLMVGTLMRREPNERGPFEALLREWLPFMLSLAITAGIAPLLFIQILYRPQFYTANLLSFHRWMAVLPVLIIGFYLLYLLKTRWAAARSRLLDTLIALVTTACFVFIAWSWTENHLLSLSGQKVWTQQFASRSILYHSAEMLPRLSMWFCGMFPVLAVWLSWQVWWTNSSATHTGIPGTRRGAALGLMGIVTASVSAGLYWSAMPRDHQSALRAASMIGFWVLTLLGLGGLSGMFGWQYVSRRLSSRRLAAMSLALVLTLSGVACLREAIRLQSVAIESLLPIHEAAAAVGGRWVFAAFLVINVGLIVWCLQMVLRSRGEPSSRTAD